MESGLARYVCVGVFTLNSSLQQASSEAGKDPPASSSKATKGTELIADEEAKTGRVHFSILLAYCRACTWPMTIITLFMYMFVNISSVAANFWLVAWSNAEGSAAMENFTQTTACDRTNSTIV